MEVMTSLSQGRTAAAQCGLFTHKSVPVIFEPPCIVYRIRSSQTLKRKFFGTAGLNLDSFMDACILRSVLCC